VCESPQFTTSEVLFMDARSRSGGNGRVSSNMVQNESVVESTLDTYSQNFIQTDKGQSSLVHWWETAPWFPLLLDLLIAPPLIILHQEIVQKGQNTRENPFRNPDWKILVCRLSGLGI